jgi:hypothetical protein
MSMSLRSSVVAVLAATVFGAGSAAACQTSDLAGEWFALAQNGAAGYCTLTLDETGAITASSCWVEKLKPEPKFVLTGALASDETCHVSGVITSAKPGTSFTATAKVAKTVLKSKGKGKGGKGPKDGGGKDGKDGKEGGTGEMTVNMNGRLVSAGELINGLIVESGGHFTPVVITRSN